MWGDVSFNYLLCVTSHLVAYENEKVLLTSEIWAGLNRNSLSLLHVVSAGMTWRPGTTINGKLSHVFGVEAGCWLRPQWGCQLEHVHVTFPCDLHFLTALHLGYKGKHLKRQLWISYKRKMHHSLWPGLGSDCHIYFLKAAKSPT